jgi:hypothetical protein
MANPPKYICEKCGVDFYGWAVMMLCLFQWCNGELKSVEAKDEERIHRHDQRQ